MSSGLLNTHPMNVLFLSDSYADMDRPQVKLTLSGDGAVGKTCLAIRRVVGKFPEEYIPTVFDNYPMDTVIDDKPLNYAIGDYAGGVL